MRTIMYVPSGAVVVVSDEQAISDIASGLAVPNDSGVFGPVTPVASQASAPLAPAPAPAPAPRAATPATLATPATPATSAKAASAAAK